MRRHVLFFDDYPLEDENKIFVVQLKAALQSTDIVLIEEKTIPHLDASLKARSYAAIILDIMSAFPGFSDDEAQAGMEILKRCRAGHYGSINQQALIFMRTARGELQIRQLAFSLGCTDFFRAGSQDDKLLEAMVRHLVQS